MSDDQQQPPEETPAETPVETPVVPAPEAAPPVAGAQIPGAEKKLLAGILAIVVGSLGIHKFVLGYTKEGVIMLSCTIGGYILGIIGSMVVIGCVFFLLPMAAGVIGLVEGIMYLTKSDEEFVNTYITNKKPWF
jgi:TM2 domain-containing membrane protein YozV